MYIISKRNYRVNRHKAFSTYYRLRLPSHQQEVFDQIDTLEREHNDLDREVEEFKEIVKDNEREYMEEGEVSELTKSIDVNVSSKDKLAGNIGEIRDVTLFDEGKVRAEKYLILQEVNALAKKDVEILKDIKSSLPEEDGLHDIASNLIGKLESAAGRSCDLHKELSSRELHPLQSNSTFVQDSSEVRQTDFSSFDPFDE